MSTPLDMTCDRCPVSNFCPKNGQSPSFLNNGARVYCKVIGGFGRTPIDEDILSENSKELIKSSGPCLTLAYVPVLKTEDGKNYETELVKIFHPAVLSPREKIPSAIDGIYPRSHS